jgi:hypothetical protein
MPVLLEVIKFTETFLISHMHMNVVHCAQDYGIQRHVAAYRLFHMYDIKMDVLQYANCNVSQGHHV